MPRHALQCHATGYAALCYATLCYAMLHYAMPCHGTVDPFVQPNATVHSSIMQSAEQQPTAVALPEETG